MPWYLILGYSVGVGVILWFIFQGLEIGLDWILSRHIRKELDDLNRTAPPLPRRIPGQSLKDDDGS